METEFIVLTKQQDEGDFYINKINQLKVEFGLGNYNEEALTIFSLKIILLEAFITSTEFQSIMIELSTRKVFCIF